MHHHVWALMACGALLLTSAARAQDTEAERTAMARALFNEGVEMSDRGQWEDAADRFRRALALRETAQIRYNLGRSLYEMGRLLEAGEVLRPVEAADDAGVSVKRSARDLLGRIESRLGQLTIQVEGGLAGREVTLDGHTVPEAVLGVAVPADPGTREVEVRDGDQVVAHETVRVRSGRSAEVTLHVVPTPGEAAEAGMATGDETPATAPDGGEAPSRGWIWAVLGVAAAGAVAAVLVVVLAGGSNRVRGDFDPPVLSGRVPDMGAGL